MTSESYASCRQRGRAEQFRMWTKDAGQFAKEQREKTRRIQEEKAEKHNHLMAAIEREKALDKILNCPLCDVVKAEAYGLGHMDWNERVCSKCFAASSERLAQQRHSSPPPFDAALNSLLLGLTVQERLHRTENMSLAEPETATWTQEPFLPHRSRRLSPSPSPSPSPDKLGLQTTDDIEPHSTTDRSSDEGLDEMLAALKRGDTKEVLRLVLAFPHLEQCLDQALPPQPQATPSTAHSTSAPLSSLPPAETIPAIDKVRAQLKQAEEDLVFAPTQRERSSALNLAFKLRKELAILVDLDRREKRAKEIYKHKIRSGDPLGPDTRRPKDESKFDPSEGIKTIIRDQDENRRAPAVKGKGIACPGLAIAAESKARRTERALQERLHSHSKETLTGFGIVATLSSAARTREEANAYQRPIRASSSTQRPASGLTNRDPRNQITHPDKPDPLLMVDAVTWRPASPHLPSYHPPGFAAVGDYDGLDPMAELAKLRTMKVDDYASQRRKEKEWKRVVAEVAFEIEGTTVKTGGG